MERYLNEFGDVLVVVEDEYIIYDKHDDAPKCETFDEEVLNKYLASGFKRDRSVDNRVQVGICTCGSKIFEGNRIKARDYFECAKCQKISTRNDLTN